MRKYCKYEGTKARSFSCCLPPFLPRLTRIIVYIFDDDEFRLFSGTFPSVFIYLFTLFWYLPPISEINNRILLLIHTSEPSPNYSSVQFAK